MLVFDYNQIKVTHPYAELWIWIKNEKIKKWKKSDANEMVKEASDFFQNTKFCPIFNIYNSADDQCFKIGRIPNLMTSCSMSYLHTV